MKIAVTGGLGFIGSNFIRHILACRKNCEVINIDKKTYAGNPDNLRDIIKGAPYKWVRADIADDKKMFHCLKGVSAVIHFAAETHVDRSILSPGEFIKTNVAGTQVLLDAARANNVKRFVHVSTDEVYGSIIKGESVEPDALLPNSPYSASKAASDLLARAYFVTFKMPVMITRCSNNFGPYQFPEKALPLLITNAMENKSFPLYGKGQNVRDWLFVLDHVKAIERVLDGGRPGEIYNIGGGRSLSNIELVKRVLKIMGKPQSLIHYVADRPGHDLRYALNCDKIKKELGWKPETSFEDALKFTFDWYSSNKSWWEKLKNKGRYKKYYKKQYARNV
ncbi:MAG: dTDP-glucose 4,6-dehydratase [Elusimicrobia bacterium]|nr:dTDP-glucose 4,6-dehydratase [Elusimicrobiota bacterium]